VAGLTIIVHCSSSSSSAAAASASRAWPGEGEGAWSLAFLDGFLLVEDNRESSSRGELSQDCTNSSVAHFNFKN